MHQPSLFRAALVLLTLVSVAQSFTHEWNTVTDMLGMNPHASNNGRYNDSPFAMKHWKWVAENYAVIVLGGFEDFVPIGGYNCTCPLESSRTQVARILKKFNPKIKLLWYQNEVGDMTCKCCNEAVRLRPEWWLRDDNGKPILFGTDDCSIDPATKQPREACAPYVNFSVPGVGEWWYQQPLLEVCDSDASLLVDGIMMDGADYFNRWKNVKNVSKARLTVAYDGKMRALSEASEMYHALNGGEVWGNPLMAQDGTGHWGPPRPGDVPADSYNRSLQHYDGAFDESFGALSTLKNEWGECITEEPMGPFKNITCTGQWDVQKMRESMYAMRNATMIDKKTLCVHAFPGPAGTLVSVNGTASTHPSPPHNTMSGDIMTFGWWGPVKAPAQWMKAPEYAPIDVVNATKQASADMLVQSLAPFLIVAEETSFFGYGWFYDMESGYAPCDDNRTLCLAPDGWYPEYSKPLGPPKGPAVESGDVWTRDFAHASVFVDLRNRSLSRIDWKPPI